jgi:hypothetical protein
MKHFANLSSLFKKSPKPGVSMMVSLSLTPSSSTSAQHHDFGLSDGEAHIPAAIVCRVIVLGVSIDGL